MVAFMFCAWNGSDWSFDRTKVYRRFLMHFTVRSSKNSIGLISFALMLYEKRLLIKLLIAASFCGNRNDGISSPSKLLQPLPPDTCCNIIVSKLTF